jgi:SAM-dependent methyltransferase
MPDYDPSLYEGAAPYYISGRPAYSRELVQTLAAEVGLDGSGRLLDVGCGPGVLALALADLFEETIGIDPDVQMLIEGMRRAEKKAADNIWWGQARAEKIADFDFGKFRLVTFGQSFHWTERERVAEMVYDCLEPGGAIAVINHVCEGRPQPQNPGYPPIPHEAIKALLERYLGPRRRAGQGFLFPPPDSSEAALARTRFGTPRILYCPGRADIVQDREGVLANYLSTSFAAPHLFGERLTDFEADFRTLLAAHSPTGLFWDWPGDTQIILAKRPRVDAGPLKRL